MLISKLVEIKEREHLEKIEDIKRVQKEITRGSQIQSYVLSLIHISQVFSDEFSVCH